MDNNNKNADELGYVSGDTVNFKAVFGKLRRKTEEFAEASKKLAGDVGEAIKNSVKEAEPAEVEADPEDSSHIVIASEPTKSKSKARTVEDELSLDLDEMKNQISDAVKNAMGGESDISKLISSVDNMSEALENVKIRLQAIQISSEDGLRESGNNIAAMKTSVSELKNRINEISQSINNVSRVSDSVFDLKNAQINMKKSIDNFEVSVKSLKKKLNASVAVLSIMGVLIIALQIIAILS